MAKLLQKLLYFVYKKITMLVYLLCFRSYCLKIFPFLLFGLPSSGLSAHGDLHERILKTTKEIKISPDSAYLYFKRGKLYFHHEDYSLCLKDFQKSDSLGYQETMQDLLVARAFYKLKLYDKALETAQQILDKKPKNIHATKVVARITFEQENYREAAIAFEAVIENTIKTLPENYIDAASAWNLTASEEGYLRAIKILESGISQLGPLISFYDKIKEIALDRKDLEQAIASQKKILNLSNRKEFAYYELAMLNIKAGQSELALDHFQKAKTIYEQLAFRNQQSQAIKQLKIKIEESIIRLNND